MVNKGEILYKSRHHKKGRQHDYTVYKDEQPQTSSQVENVLYLGYLRCENDFPTVKYRVLPIKKKRNTVLTEEQKEYNKNHSRQRVIIEHTICMIKKFCIMGTKYRNRLKRYDHISDIVSGLVNYTIMKNSVLP
jgi:hypothetical protein